MKRMKYILTATLCLTLATGAATAEDKAFNEARIYVNPGHGGWGANDRNLATITHAMGDTTGFYETNTNLRKSLQLYHDLVDNGAGKVMISRTKNGVDSDTQIDGIPQIVGLSAICEDVEANNIDYFISIHSNAASEGTSTNYPLVLYRGTDEAVGNGLVDAKNMGLAAWPFINDNDITFKSHYTKPESNNVRGDITFMGGSTTSMGYTGYYGVLRHGADGYLIEGCFHTYHPERHRLLNEEYCQQEGMRYARAIRSWFNGPKETTGDIMGTVKNATKPLTHNLYKYKAASMDAYAPLNGVTVVLRDASGAEVASKTTDMENNGVFVFSKLKPGKYTLDFTGLTEYHPYKEEIEVTANKTVFTNVKLTGINEELPDEEAPAPEVSYYPHPEQDGDIATASNYQFSSVGEPVSAAALEGLTVRRSILRDGKYYILAHTAERVPHLLVVNPTDGSLIKEMSLEGLHTEGFNGKEMSWTLSDIAFTNDGVLIGTNSVVIGRAGNSYCNGDFYMFAWKGDETTPLEDQKPVVVMSMATNNTDNIGDAGNNYSNLMANSIAVDGNFNDFNFYFDSHAGGGWDSTYGLRYVCWTMKDGKKVSSQWNDAPSQYDESQFGESAMMTLSPLALYRLIVDGEKISAKEFEVEMVDGNDAVEHEGLPADAVSEKSAGANYFRYADDILMASPIYNEKDNSYDVALFNITKGLKEAREIGRVNNLLTTEGWQPMSAFGVVRNAEIDLYLMAGNKIAKVTTEGNEQTSAEARILAYDLKQTQPEADTYELSYRLNIPADQTSVNVIDRATGLVELTIPGEAMADNTYKVTVKKADVAENTAYRWEVTATAPNVTRFSETKMEQPLSSPYGIAINNNPDHEMFGNIYISNTVTTAEGTPTQQGGILRFGNDGKLLNQGATSCGIEWTGVKGEGPRRLAVAADGRIFAADCSKAHAGIYVIDAAATKGAPLFKDGKIDANGKVTVNGTYVGGRTYSIAVRGAGKDTQIFAIDGSAEGTSGWKKFTNRYDIGEASEWTAAPNMSKASSSYVGNENSSLAAVSGGYWGAQYRGAGSSNTGTPCLFYYSDKQGDVVFDSSKIDSESSQNGALAVDKDEKTLAHSYAGGVRVFNYRINREGNPVMDEQFIAKGLQIGEYIDALAFDYAGNLYAVSSVGNAWSRFAMPTSDNTITVPASADMLVQFGSSVADETVASELRLFPNPATDVVTIESNQAVNTVEVFSATSGAEVLRAAGNGQTVMTLDVTSLMQGVYLVKVNGTETMKLIKR